MRFSPPLQYLERGPGGEVSESPAFNRGATPEEIVIAYPAVSLADIYSVIAYYLRHQQDVKNWGKDDVS